MRMKNNKFLMLLLSFVISFALWAYVVTNVSTEKEDTFYNIPVVLDNESALTTKGLVLASDQQPTVTLKLKGSRANIDKLSRDNITIVANLATIYESGPQALSYSIVYPNGIPNNAFEIINQSPSLVTVQVESRISKEVPVQVYYEGTMPDAEKYICDTENLELTATEVNVTGPKSVIDQIHHAKIVVDMTGRTNSFSENYIYTLCNEEGEGVDAQRVVTNVGEITLTMEILQVKDVKLVVTVVDGGGATQETSSIKIDPPTIKISGTETLLAEMHEIHLGTINLSEILQDETLTFAIKLPEGANNLTGMSEAKVDVQFPELMTATFTVTNITPINVPEGLEAEIVTKELTVQVRGPKSMVETMKSSDISVTVDFSGGQVGTTTMAAKVEIASRFSGVGQIGTCSVSATLREPEEEKTE